MLWITGLRIPEDIAVIGCGNLHYDDSLRVPLSSIDQHSRRIGEEAARLALRILNSKAPLKPETVVLQPELVVRRSTQRRAAKPASSKEVTSLASPSRTLLASFRRARLNRRLALETSYLGVFPNLPDHKALMRTLRVALHLRLHGGCSAKLLLHASGILKWFRYS